MHRLVFRVPLEPNSRIGVEESIQHAPRRFIASRSNIHEQRVMSAASGSGHGSRPHSQDALGGADKIAAMHDLDWTVKAGTFDHEGKPIGQVTKRTHWIRPDYLRLDQVGPGDTYVRYFDGRSGWEILPDNPE
jgi:hypothetical protein